MKLFENCDKCVEEIKIIKYTGKNIDLNKIFYNNNSNIKIDFSKIKIDEDIENINFAINYPAAKIDINNFDCLKNKKFDNLIKLDLSMNALSTKDIKFLKSVECINLKELNLRYNLISK